MKYLALLLFSLPFSELHGAYSQSESTEKPAFVHAVYFWLHDNVTEAQKAEFIALLKNFKKIKSVTRVYVGPPAGTPRTIVDSSYDVALIVHFKNKEGQDFYQVDKIHTDAIKIFEGWIKDIKIYDMVTEASMRY